MNMRILYVLLFTPALLTAQNDFETDSLFLTRIRPYTIYELTEQQISTLPVRGLSSYLRLINGVDLQDGSVHTRGGRDDETAYFVNGFSTIDPLDNSNAIYVIPEAMERLAVLPGFFPARYGGGNSGLVFTRLKRGTPDLHFSFDYQTDKFARAGEQFLETYSYRDFIFTATASGPLYFNNLYFFVALENTRIGDAAKRFSSGFSFENLIDQSNRFRDDEPSNPKADDDSKLTRHSYKPRAAQNDDVPDTISITYPDGFTPFNNRNSWNVNATVQYDLNPFTFDVTLLYNWNKMFSNNRPMLEILNRRQDYMQYNKWLVGFKMIHELSRNMTYDVSIGYYDNRSENYDAYFGNNWQLWGDSTAVAEATGDDVTYANEFGSGPYSYWINGFFIYPNGTAPGNYLKNDQYYWNIDANFEWNIHKRNKLNLGFGYRRYIIRRYEMNPAVMYLIKYYNAFTEFPPAALSDFAGNTYGYDLLGTEIEGGINGSRKPVFAAIYLEDQIRSGELIFNLGLRYDYLKSNTYTVRGFQNIGVDINTGLIADSEWHIKDAVQQISPRISLTWLSEPDIQYYLNYGHFVQLPRFNQYYYNAYQYARQAVRGGYYYYQPIGFALDPIYTKMTELGINLGISKIGSVHLAGFYKSTKGLTRIKTVKPPPGADWITYWMVDNGDRSIVKGVEIGLDLTRLKRLSARIMYSLSSAEGTGSNEISYYNAVYYGSTSPKIDSPLDFNRTHSGSVMLDYRFDPGEGGIFASSGINLVARFSSGHPYTYSSFSCG